MPHWQICVYDWFNCDNFLSWMMLKRWGHVDLHHEFLHALISTWAAKKGQMQFRILSSWVTVRVPHFSRWHHLSMANADSGCPLKEHTLSLIKVKARFYWCLASTLNAGHKISDTCGMVGNNINIYIYIYIYIMPIYNKLIQHIPRDKGIEKVQTDKVKS